MMPLPSATSLLAERGPHRTVPACTVLATSPPLGRRWLAAHRAAGSWQQARHRGLAANGGCARRATRHTQANAAAPAAPAAPAGWA